VVGTAEGRAAGNALNWRYTLALPVDGKVYEVQFDDWMYLMDERVMLNKAVMSKFGMFLGEVTLSFQKSQSPDMPLNPRIDDWTGRVVWLVGASTGIGRATAERLHALGAGRGVGAQRGHARRLRAQPPGSLAIALDATDREGDARRRAQHRRHTRPHRPGGVLRRLLQGDARHRLRPRRRAAPRAGQLRRRAAPARRRAAGAAAPAPATSAWSAACRATAACPRRWPTGRPRQR
jgi:hypothetical protein